MSNALSRQLKSTAYKIWAFQLIGVLAVAAVSLFWGSKSAVSVVLGGVVHLITALFLIHFGFSHSGARAAKKIVQNFFFGEFLKIIFTVALFVLVFKFLPVSIGFLFIGFGVALAMFWVGSMKYATTH